VIRMKNLSYDVWGETVTLAEMFGSSGNPGTLCISGASYERVTIVY
jgi:class 3 adenylate cyclase